MPAVLLVRHAQASFGSADYDRLSDLGRTQAQAVVRELRRRGVRIDRIVSGDLVRQRDTAGPLAEACSVPLEIDPRWNEYETDDILARHSPADVRLEPTGGNGPGSSSAAFQDILDGALASWVAARGRSLANEPWTTFSGRVAAALAELCAGLGAGGTAVVCTSGGALAAACAGVLGLDDAFVPLQRVTVNAGISRVVHGGRGTALLSFNDYAHLEAEGGRALVTFR